MLTKRFVATLSATMTVASLPGLLFAQTFPTKPVRIVTAAAGGGSDFTARLIAQGITGPLGQPVIVDNRSSGGIIAGEVMSKSAPDGHTLFLGGASIWIVSLLQKVPYDFARDFAPVSLLTRDVNVLVVHPTVQAASVKDLVALAKAKPGALNYGSAGNGSPQHLGMELLKSMAGIDLTGIRYKGTAPAVTALAGGEVQLTIADPGVVNPHVKQGRLKALAVTSAEPSALTPGLPTVSASGVPGYEWVGMTVMFAPSKTPEVFIARINQEVVRVLRSPENKERLFNAGSEVVGNSPEQFSAIVKSDIARVSKVIKDAGIKVD
jgi:tripartite-type tricarboxylate transporter receptor subunit TctC